MSKKIIIAGGGTGGHIFPAIAIANALKKIDPTIQLLFVGANGKMEMEKVPQAGFEIRGLDIAGFNRSSLIKNFALPFKLVKSFFQVSNIFKTFQPDAVVGVGGYSSFPVLRYAQAKGIPSFIHESNSFAGKSNILLGKKASKVFVAGEGMEKFFPREKIVITGNPIRKSIADVAFIEKKEALDFFGLHQNKRTVLAVGGSLGARSINEAIATHLNLLHHHNVQLIWQTGKNDAEQWIAKAKGQSNIWVDTFITQMEYAYAAADVVISRSGAMAVAELSAVKKPVVFVPYPFAAEDHQTANAQALVKNGAAYLVKDSDAKKELVQTALQLMEDENRQNQLTENISKLAKLNADAVIAKEILNYIGLN